MSSGVTDRLNFSLFFAVFCSLLLKSKAFHYDFVTCGSVLKLQNVRGGARLHSHDVKYGSGSGQQSVTAVDSSDDNNSYWSVRGKMGADCVRGTPIECGQTIRLTHVNTGKNLHSHHFQSPLSHHLEVSAFGDGGRGDEGDHWVITCPNVYWRRDAQIRIKHVVTETYLHVSGDTYGRPIHGQKEVSSFSQPNALNLWSAAEGIFVKPTESYGIQSDRHDEL